MSPSSASDEKGHPNSNRILVVAPTSNDARLTVNFLCKAGFDALSCADISELQERLDDACGCIIIAEESLRPRSLSLLSKTLDAQPSWSDIPIIVITNEGDVALDRLQRLASIGPGGSVSVLERPFRPGTLVTATSVALRARTRQYEVRDLLTALKNARDEAERASRAKDEFLAALSHELRTPLNPVLLIAGAGAEDTNLPARVRADFAVIRKNINLEARLIDDLLDLTRIARGKLQLDQKLCDLHDIVADAIGNVQGELKEKQITLAEDFAARESQVSGDPVRLQQVFWNVLQNAVKFVPPDSKISISSKIAGGNNIEIAVTDTGIGLAKEELEHIFDAFSQGDHRRAESPSTYGGLGLGLSISRMLVEMQSGTISATSEGLGRGSTFTVTLPLATAPVEISGQETTRPTMGRKGASSGGRHRVLLVEDHADTLAVMSLLLGMQYDVITAATAQDARARAAENRFDLVVSDIGLPDQKGYDLMAFLQQEYGLKGIALSGYGMEKDIARSKQAGFIEQLTKPVEFGALQNAVDRALTDET